MQGQQQLVVADTGFRYLLQLVALVSSCSGNHRLQILLAADGSCLRVYGSKGAERGRFSSPFGIAVDSKCEFIVVADTENHRVQVLRFSDGACMCCVGSRGSNNGQFESPRDVAILRDGRFLITDAGNNRMQIFQKK